MGRGRLTRIAEAAIARAPADKLHEIAARYREMGNEWIRRMVIERNRIDILATAVLGYEVKPFHIRMLQHQFRHPKSLILSYRGSGKSTTCTIVKAIHTIVRNPNIRILLASKSTGNAEAFLKEIKGHLERNEKLAEVFGLQFDPRRVGKWDTREIEVLPRTSNAKEATVTAVGVDGTVVSKHYDMILSDDLVDEDNSRTPFMRRKVRTWYYQTLDPCLEPPDERFPERGQHHHLGTRYHYDDLYGHLMGTGSNGDGGELAEASLIIPALDEEGRSPWPEKHPPEWLEEKRRAAGIIIFGAQYLCNTEAMKGEIFRYDDCQVVGDDEIPRDLVIYQGCDLAIGEKSKNDKFSHCTIGVDRKTENVYVLDWYEGQLRFNMQKEKILDLYDKHDPIRAIVEAVAYQAAQIQEIKRERPEVRIFGVDQRDDKITRAQKLSALFDAKKVFFRRGGNIHLLIEQLVLFPSAAHDDGVDALELAVRASRMRRRRKRRTLEPGVL